MLRAYTDGACRVSNPGVCSCAWVLYDGLREVHNCYQYLGPGHSNNYAEYQGLLSFLNFAFKNGLHDVMIHCDSALVVNQVNQRWSAENKPELKMFMTEAYGLLTAGHHKLIHVRGHGGNENTTDNEGNARADELCNLVLDVHKEEYERVMAESKK